MTSTTQEAPVISLNARVTITAMADPDPDSGDFTVTTQVPGTVTRLWTNGRYVTVRTDDGRTFVRDLSTVKEV
jgi:hypothetical protein